MSTDYFDNQSFIDK